MCSSSCVITSILLFFTHYEFSAQPSLSIFVNAKIHTYSILQNKYLCIYEGGFEAKILRDDCTLTFSGLYYAPFTHVFLIVNIMLNEVKILRNDWALNKPKILFNLRVMCKAKITVSVKLL